MSSINPMMLASQMKQSKLPTLKKETRVLKRTGVSDNDGYTGNEVAKKLFKFNTDENIPRGVSRSRNLRRSVSMSNLNNIPKKPLSNVAHIRRKPTTVPPKPITKPQPTPAPAPAAVSSKAKKRSAWDYKGRLQDLEEFVGRLKSEKDVLQEKNEATDTERQQLLVTVKDVQTLNDEHAKIIGTLEANLRTSEEKVEMLKRETEIIQHQKNLLDVQVSEFKRENTELTKKLLNSENENRSKTILLDEVREINLAQKNDISVLQTENSRFKETVSIQNEQLINGELMRRELHNIVQDLKGNIRVFCRVRPLSLNERTVENGCVSFPDPDQKIISINSSRRESIVDEGLTGVSSTSSSRPLTHEFRFDRVFDPEATQSVVFGEISQLVQSALDGYNVCVFAYGPTGSGKTYTMEGICEDYEGSAHVGMIPRTVDQVFESIELLKTKGWKYQLSASYVEIYNEKIRDLLNINSTDNYEIKFTKEKEPYVTNVKNIKVTSNYQVLDLIKNANKNRAVAATKSNDRSSRSHSVFSLKLSGVNESLDQTCKAVLNLIDLAGSERVKISGSEGERLKEAQNINKSLSNLGNVILALANKAEHIPYRNSKLTLLLSNSLGGNAKTLMFINISPSEGSYQETLNSLRFAKMVNDCYIGVAQKKR